MRATSFLLAVNTAAAAAGTPGGLLPPWPATWDMARSTAFMPCNVAGAGPVPFAPTLAATWGIADFVSNRTQLLCTPRNL